MKRLEMIWGVVIASRLTAQFHHVEDAAAFLAISACASDNILHLPTGLRVWVEGADGFAGESYDEVATKAHERVAAHRKAESALVGTGLGRR